MAVMPAEPVSNRAHIEEEVTMDSDRESEN
jgi:hypothetical protein